jgi:hypothetical protein
MADNTYQDDDYKAAYDEVCAALGHAISCWSTVESELSRIYAVAMKSPEMGLAIETFYTVIGFDSRLKMANVAMQSTCYAHRDVIKTWNNLVNRIKTQAKIRNKLAHGIVIGLSKPIANMQERRKLSAYWFIPYFGTLRAKQSVFGLVKTGPDAAEKLTTVDLRKIAERYAQLGNELQRLYLDGLVPITSGKKK